MYTTLAARLKLLPLSAKNAKGVNYDLVLDPAAVAAERPNVLSSDVKGHLKVRAKGCGCLSSSLFYSLVWRLVSSDGEPGAR